MRPEVAAEVREWLERSVDDLREAEHDLTATPPLVRGAVFHSQQAVEKALKAFLAAHDLPLRRTHDLDELGTAVVALDATLTGVVDRAKELTPTPGDIAILAHRQRPATMKAATRSPSLRRSTTLSLLGSRPKRGRKRPT